MATTFTDNQSREWNCRINYAGMRSLADAGLPLKEIEVHLQELLCGDVVLFDWLWAILKDQAEEMGVSREEFNCEIFEVSGKALKAFIEAVENFFQNLNPSRARVFRAGIDEVEKEMASISFNDVAS